MTGRCKFFDSRRVFSRLAGALAITFCITGGASVAAIDGAEASARSGTGAMAETSTTAPRSGLRLAQQKQFKYEVPKAPRVAPTTPAPPVAPRAAPSPKKAPTYVPQTGPSTRSAPSTGGGGGARLQIGPFGFSLGGGGGGGGGGSCEGCRNACYNSYHGTKKFVPCMRGCWNNYCRGR